MARIGIDELSYRKGPDLRKFRDEQGHYLRERHRAVCGSLLNPRTIYRRVTSRFFIHGCSMTKNLLLGSIAGNFLPVEDRQPCAKPARFAQGTSGGLGPAPHHGRRRSRQRAARVGGRGPLPGHAPRLLRRPGSRAGRAAGGGVRRRRGVDRLCSTSEATKDR